MNLQEEDTLVAVYIVVPHYPITVMVEPAYSGTVQFENGYVTSDEMTVVMEGAVPAPFIASAEENFTFKNWEYRYSTIQGDVETPIVNFTFNAPDTIVAHFDKDPLLYYVPNSFSPNGDGINDVFRPVTHAGDPEYYHLIVFNRWGDKVFESSDPKEYWTGEYRGGEYFVSDNVYMFQLEVKWVHAEQYVKKTGTIMVFR
ncbi:MAG: gliding motility-associated C-terminal domain-containing protein [Flavobacteriales bacterium]